MYYMQFDGAVFNGKSIVTTMLPHILQECRLMINGRYLVKMGWKDTWTRKELDDSVRTVELNDEQFYRLVHKGYTTR